MALTCTQCGDGLNGGAERCPSCGATVIAAPISLSKDAPSTPVPVFLGDRKAPADGPTAVAPPVVSLGKLDAPAAAEAADPFASTLLPEPPIVEPRPPTDESNPNRRRWVLGLAAAIVLVVAIAGAGIVLNDESDPASTANDDPTATASPLAIATGPTAELTEQVTGPADAANAASQLTGLTKDDLARATELEQQGVWVPQLASMGPGESAEGFLVRYEAMIDRYPDAIVIWSGDWPGSFGPSSARSWVVLNAGLRKETTQPVLNWCAAEGWEDGECWAKRLDSAGDDPSMNTDHAPADDRNN